MSINFGVILSSSGNSNLTKFKPGQVANPKGRPSGTPNRMDWAKLTARCKREFGSLLCYDHPELGKIKDINHLAFVKLWEGAEEGKQWAVIEILNRSLGKPVGMVDMRVDKVNSVKLEWPSAIVDVEDTREQDALSGQEPGKVRSGADIQVLGGEAGTDMEVKDV